MTKNAEAQQRFRDKKIKEGLKEVRGIFAPKALHSLIKKRIKLIIKKMIKQSNTQ